MLRSKLLTLEETQNERIVQTSDKWRKKILDAKVSVFGLDFRLILSEVQVKYAPLCVIAAAAPSSLNNEGQSERKRAAVERRRDKCTVVKCATFHGI